MKNLAIVFLLLISSCFDDKKGDILQDPEYWKEQAFNQILPYWTRHAIDTTTATFRCTLDEAWQVTEETVFPSMVSRHLFSYSFAYLINGNESNLDMARYMADYLISKTWDEQYGGWYNALDKSGNPDTSGKSTFVQVYVATGLAMFYFITRDPEILEYIDRTNDLLEQKAWDREKGGYFDFLERDWTVKNTTKSLSSQVAPVSGHLLYLHLTTRNERYLDQSRRIFDTVLENMVDPQTGWVLETFDRDWNYQPTRKNEAEVDIGHNLEVSWMLFRLHMIRNDAGYLNTGSKLADQVISNGFVDSTGIWVHAVNNADPRLRSDNTYWWIQAYGNMFSLCLHRLFPDRNALSVYRKGASFWDTYFLDRDRGDTHFSVFTNGDPKDSRKANQFKSSYHSIEHSLLNYLYLKCWQSSTPLHLYFKIQQHVSGEPFYPLPIESHDGVIETVKIIGENFVAPKVNNDAIRLPGLNDASVEIIYHFPE
jgi:cellobiose epimerase